MKKVFFLAGAPVRFEPGAVNLTSECCHQYATDALSSVDEIDESNN